MAVKRLANTGIVAVLFVVGIAIAAGGFLLFSNSTLDSASREAAERMIQLGLIVVVGGGVKFLIDRAQESNRERARQQERDIENLRALREQRIDFLRRARACHVRVDYARRLIGAHGTQNTWFEQSRELMRVRPEFAEIAEDLKTAESMFDSADSEKILRGLKAIDRYLGELENEYIEYKTDADKHAADGQHKLDYSVNALDLKWVDDFRAERGSRFIAGYDEPLTDVKSTMREYIYGSQER